MNSYNLSFRAQREISVIIQKTNNYQISPVGRNDMNYIFNQIRAMLRVLTQTTLIFLFMASSAHADTCPSPKDIRDREISTRYDWAVGENTTLKELLSVQTLYAVRIMDYDSYVSCRYTTKKWPVILDGTPRAEQCRVMPTGGEWTGTDSGQLVCREKDVTKCLFNLECK